MSSGRAAPDGADGAGAAWTLTASGAVSDSATGSAHVFRLRVGVGGEQHRGVALGVEHFHCAVGIFGQFQGVGSESGDGRRRLHADLDEPLHTQAACRLFDEQQILRFDPAHRTGELPSQQFDEDPARHLVPALAVPGVVVGEDLVERLGGHQIPDFLDEVAIQCERPRYQVGDIAPDDQVGILVARHDPVQRAAEIGHPDPQYPRVEGHVDAGHQDERAPAAGELAASFHLFFQRFQASHGAGDRVLRAAQVEVHDLQELTGALCDVGDECGNLVVGQVDLRGPDRRQPVVGAAQFVARHDVVHLRAAVKHHFQQGFQLVDARHAGQRGVLADRVTACDCTFDEGALLAHLGDLRGGHGRHRHLGELRQVQHALGVVVVHTTGDDAGRVVAHHVQHREAQRVTGELVRRVPHFAGRLGTGPDLHTHALVLDALAGERVDRLGGRQSRGRRHHQIGTDARGYLQNLCTLVDSDAVDTEVDLVAGTHHAQEPRGPADQPGRWAGLTVGGGHHVLRGGRQPHAMHDGRFQARQQRGRPVGVNGVVVAGHHRERAHVDRRGQRDVAAAAARSVGRVLRTPHHRPGPGR